MENLLFPELNNTAMEQELELVKTTEAKRADIYKVPFSKLRIVEGLNIRQDYGNIEELADSIKENGVKNALRGYKKDNLFYVVDGHRRFTAMQALYNDGIEVTAPFIIQDKATNDEQQVVDMFITNEGKSLTPLEQAEGVRRLLAYGWSEKQIATRLSKSIGYIIKLNLLNAAPKKLLNLIVEGVISSTYAMEICSKGEAYMWLKDYEEGKFNKPAEVNGEEKEEMFEFEHEPKEKQQPERITKKSSNKINSWKYFSKFVKSSADEIKPERKEAFNFFMKVMENKVSMEEIQEFFSIFENNENE